MFLSLSIWSAIVKYCKWSGLRLTQCTCPGSGAQEVQCQSSDRHSLARLPLSIVLLLYVHTVGRTCSVRAYF